MGTIQRIFNFDNIGGKIKNLAKWSCWISIILIWICVPFAIISLIVNENPLHYCLIPIFIAVLTSFLVWISSWIAYAFGEFVEDIHTIRNKEQTSNTAVSYSSNNYATPSCTAVTNETSAKIVKTEQGEGRFNLNSFENLDLNKKNKADWNSIKYSKGYIRGNCEMCGSKKQELVAVEFEDFFGKANRNMCYECFCKYNPNRK